MIVTLRQSLLTDPKTGSLLILLRMAVQRFIGAFVRLLFDITRLILQLSKERLLLQNNTQLTLSMVFLEGFA